MVASKNRIFSPILRIAAGIQALEIGLVDQATELADMAGEMIVATGEVMAMPELLRLKSAIAKAIDDSVAAQGYLETSLEAARQQGSILLELRTAIDLARLLQEQGRNDEAIALLDPVHNSIDEGDCPEYQATARELLMELV
jgi:hypothetical protein